MSIKTKGWVMFAIFLRKTYNLSWKKTEIERHNLQGLITEQAREARASPRKFSKGPKNKQDRALQNSYLVSFDFDANIMLNYFCAFSPVFNYFVFDNS